MGLPARTQNSLAQPPYWWTLPPAAPVLTLVTGETSHCVCAGLLDRRSMSKTSSAAQVDDLRRGYCAIVMLKVSSTAPPWPSRTMTNTRSWPGSFGAV
ncbi:MAG: hypothetical protein ACI9U2_004517 [Bradymonadia bacterium]|jgi:hypothetical protein